MPIMFYTPLVRKGCLHKLRLMSMLQLFGFCKNLFNGFLTTGEDAFTFGCLRKYLSNHIWFISCALVDLIEQPSLRLEHNLDISLDRSNIPVAFPN